MPKPAQLRTCSTHYPPLPGQDHFPLRVGDPCVREVAARHDDSLKEPLQIEEGGLIGDLQHQRCHAIAGSNLGPAEEANRMPIEMVRARLLDEAPPRRFEAKWRFYGDPERGSTTSDAPAR